MNLHDADHFAPYRDWHSEDIDEAWLRGVKGIARACGLRYILPRLQLFSTKYGCVTVMDGFMSDGSSGPAIDLWPRAFWLHDYLYTRPVAMVGGNDMEWNPKEDPAIHICKRLTKMQCDLCYYRELRASPMPLARAAAWHRFAGLTVGGWPGWLRTRRAAKKIMREHFDFDDLPKSECIARAENYLARRWRFPCLHAIDFGQSVGGNHNWGWCEIDGLRLADVKSEDE